MVDNTTTAPANPGAIVIDDEIYSRLKDLLASSDQENWVIAQHLLHKVDIEPSVMYIRELAFRYADRMVNLRTKLGRKFRDETNLFFINHSSNRTFAQWLDKKGWLTPERFQTLSYKMKQDLQRTDTFYEYHITIKDEYRYLDPDDQLTKLNDL